MKPYKKLTGPWYLKNANFTKDAGKVFSCFSCTGGSTMGYKLAGFDVIGFNEISSKIAHIYKLNHNPKYGFICSIRDLINKTDLPEEMFNLDILDGSPPCSSFSISGAREKFWGKEKKFAEGQKIQRLDDLFFEFIALAKKLQPKIIIAENVKGIIVGKARGYVKEIIKGFNDSNYDVQIFTLNSSNMGVPQARPRVFFICKRKDLNLSKLKLSFSEKPISLKEAFSWLGKYEVNKNLSIKHRAIYPLWKKANQGESLRKHHPKRSFFNYFKATFDSPSATIPAGPGPLHPTEPRVFCEKELQVISSFPMDMDFNTNSICSKQWAMGMSVPPYMAYRIAIQIKKQWIEVLNG